MTKNELIEKLQAIPGNPEIIVEIDEGYGEVHGDYAQSVHEGGYGLPDPKDPSKFIYDKRGLIISSGKE